ncbi:MAG TPA: hypothetical protein VM513_32290 [Kofleriaceae bacterium]|jgi:hypothetical protein|nr:hypothetical protein [Kofleriaceae bacterium]
MSRACLITGVLLLSVTAGCRTSKQPEPAGVPDTASMLACSKVADHVATTVVASRPRPGATHGAVANLVTTRCEQDAWADQARQCLFSITTIQEGRACAQHLTDEQRTALRTAARAMRKDAATEPADDELVNDWLKHVVEEPAAKP